MPWDSQYRVTRAPRSPQTQAALISRWVAEAVSWYDRDLDQQRSDLLAFTTRAIGLRKAHPVFRRRSFLTGQQPRPGAGDDVVWFCTDGTPMTQDKWNSGSLALAVWLNGAALTDTDAHGTVLTDDTFLILFNASWNPQVFAKNRVTGERGCVTRDVYDNWG